MNKHRYSLEKGSKKHHCPDCGKKRFVRFVDIETGEYLPEQFELSGFSELLKLLKKVFNISDFL
jgi:hypothetical protein